tara:strand:+ start:937 stop:1107 length:171 start_codon:yes stop_codon:yes gene_type:complete
MISQIIIHAYFKAYGFFRFSLLFAAIGCESMFIPPDHGTPPGSIGNSRQPKPAETA